MKRTTGRDHGDGGDSPRRKLSPDQEREYASVPITEADEDRFRRFLGKGPPARVTATFHGHVQGVGFRFTATGVARDFEVTGYVQNLPDGTVRLVAEGGRMAVKDFLAAVEKAMKGHVTRHDVSWGTPTGEFDGFGVRYS